MRLFFILSAFFLPFSVVAQELSRINSVAPIPDVPFADGAGYSVAIEGDIAVLGAPANDDVGIDAGKVFIYERSTGVWLLKQELVIGALNPSARFGEIIALNNGLLYVGVPNFNNEEGRVMIYKKIDGQWTWMNELMNDEPIYQLQRFGSSIAIDNGLVAVGAPGQLSAQEKTGAVLIFEDVENQSYPTKKVTAPLSETASRFGVSVAWNDGYLFVGDTKSKYNGLNTGAVFVYDRENYEMASKLVINENVFNFGSTLAATNDAVAISSWGQNQNMSFGGVSIFECNNLNWSQPTFAKRLLPSNSSDYGIYGFSLHLEDDKLVVGSRGGKVDIYQKALDGWANAEIISKLSEEQSTDLQRLFGYSLSYDQGTLLVGAFNWNIAQQYSGAALVYEKTGDSWTSWDERQILAPTSSNASGDDFGFSVDVHNEYAVVGAPYDDSKAESSGAVYVLKFDGSRWNRVAKLTPSDGQRWAYFGWSVAISENTVIVGALEATPTRINGIYSTGKVYVFEKPPGEWASATESQQIVRLDNLHRGAFGYSLDIKDDEMVISHFDSGSSEEIGLVYVYQRLTSGWQQKALLRPSTNQFRQFGSKVKISQDLIAVCAPISESFNGSVLLFPKPTTGWSNTSQTAVLRPSDAATFKSFGNSVDIFEETVLVGGTQNLATRGAGYLFEKKGVWKDATEDAILQPQASFAPGNRFGSAVALGRNIAVVASYQVNSESGLALVFRKTDGKWKNTSEYQTIGSFGLIDRFGYSIAMDGDNLLIGAPKADSEAGVMSGAAFFYIDAPHVLKVDSPNADRTYTVGEKIVIHVHFSQPIVVQGRPTLSLILDNGIKRDIELTTLFDNTALAFEYTVQENDFSPDLSYQNENSLFVTSNQIRSTITNSPAMISLPVPGEKNSLSVLRDIVIDGTVVVSIEKETSLDITVYPNPFSDSFRVIADSAVDIEIMTITGLPVFEGKVESQQLIHQITLPGVYIMRVTDGLRSSIIRLVKK